MSEEQAEYLSDAMAMIGMTKPKKVVQEISGFVPVFDVVINRFQDHVTALVFGRRWQYSRMEDGVCRASLDRIAKDLCLDKATVMRHTEKLVETGYLIDLTPDRRNRPHVYADAGKVVMKSSLTVAECNTGVAQNNVGVAQSQLIKQEYTKNKQNGSIEPKTIEQAIFAGKPVTPSMLGDDASRIDAANIIGFGMGVLANDGAALALAFMRERNIVIPQEKAKGQRKILKEMITMGVKPEHVTQAVKDLLAKGMTVVDMYSVAKTAEDLANKPGRQEEKPRSFPQIDPNTGRRIG